MLQLVYALYSWLFLFLAITCFITCYNLLNPKSCRYFLQFLCPAVHWNKARRFYSGKRKGSQFSSISSYSHIYSFVPSADAEFSSLTNLCTMMSWSWRFFIYIMFRFNNCVFRLIKIWTSCVKWRMAGGRGGWGAGWVNDLHFLEIFRGAPETNFR